MNDNHGMAIHNNHVLTTQPIHIRYGLKFRCGFQGLRENEGSASASYNMGFCDLAAIALLCLIKLELYHLLIVSNIPFPINILYLVE